MAIKPVGHRILVKADEAQLDTEWGFSIVSDKKLENAAMITGTIIAIGDQAWKAFGPDFTGTPWAAVGDRIMFSPYSGKNVVDPETEEVFKLMNDDDLTAVITVQEEK